MTDNEIRDVVNAKCSERRIEIKEDGVWRVYPYSLASILVQIVTNNATFRVAPEKQTRTFWVNIFKNGTFSWHISRQLSDSHYGVRIACIPVTIEFVEGDGLND